MTALTITLIHSSNLPSQPISDHCVIPFCLFSSITDIRLKEKVMAPSKQAAAPFSKDERVLCFHMEMLYEAKVLDVQPGENGDGWQYKIHYKGWKSSWDDWVPQDRIRKFTDENKDLAAQLMAQFKMLQSGKTAKAPKKGGKAIGSDPGSARGSEERNAGNTTQSGRGPRRARDFDLEHVSLHVSLISLMMQISALVNTPLCIIV
jgi:mortality factor 4-like protein 1